MFEADLCDTYLSLIQVTLVLFLIIECVSNCDQCTEVDQCETCQTRYRLVAFQDTNNKIKCVCEYKANYFCLYYLRDHPIYVCLGRVPLQRCKAMLCTIDLHFAHHVASSDITE